MPPTDEQMRMMDEAEARAEARRERLIGKFGNDVPESGCWREAAVAAEFELMLVKQKMEVGR